MAFVTQDQLVANLKFRAVIQPSDPFTEENLVELIQDAVGKHNAAYSVSATSSNVPEREKVPVVYLAWIEVCLVRASRFACDTNLTGASGFGIDRNTPFQKNMDLAARLKEMYVEECDALGLEVRANMPTTSGPGSNVTITDADTSAQIPVQIASAPPGITLDAGENPAVSAEGNLVLNYSFASFPQFGSVTIYFLDSADEGIRQPWNYSSKAGSPEINDDAMGVARITDFSRRSVKLTGLPTVEPYNIRFLAVLTNFNGLCSYSNEILIQMPPPATP